MNFFQETFVTGTHLVFLALMMIIVLGTIYFISYSFFKELIENNRKLEEMKKEDDDGSNGLTY